MSEKFNIELKTTAAYSPWSNGLLERHNQTLTEILLKIRKDNGCDWGMALDWALLAKNSMHNVYGYSDVWHGMTQLCCNLAIGEHSSKEQAGIFG